jgi:IclR family acetate operon transcriptional repressor
VERDSTLRAIARPLMLDLGARTQETVHLALPVDQHMVYIDKVESPRSVVMASRVGQQLPLHCSSLGKAYLSALDQDARRALVNRLSLDRRTSRTLTTRKSLLENLETCSERGYAMDDQENEQGVRCVGAAIRDSRGEPIAAVSISVPAERWPLEQAHEGGKLCSETAAQISMAFGAPDTGPPAG